MSGSTGRLTIGVRLPFKPTCSAEAVHLLPELPLYYWVHVFHPNFDGDESCISAHGF